MTPRRPARRPGLRAPGVALVVLAVLVGGCGGPPTAPPAQPTTTQPTATQPATTHTVPATLRAPAIDVARDDLQRLGIAADGTAEVPQDYGRVGWFDRGPEPAGRGPTVLLGHVDSRSGPAVFYRLRDLRAGDVLEVGRSDGTVARYAVERTEQVAKDRFPTFAVFGATTDDVLRLVTCAGAFDRGARSYTDNLVVHAVRV